jgi:enoyl-CoA hydratase/carnithine racemase
MGGGAEPLGAETMSQDKYGDVHILRHGHIATVTIRKPPHNMMSVDLARDLADALHALDEESDIRALVLTSEGKSFCAGADLANRAENLGQASPTSNPLYEQAVRLYSSKLPIIGAIQGPAVGAGLGLALIADLRIAAPDARFAANFVKLGFHPGFGITYTLPRLIGAQRAALLCMTGRRISGEQALDWGLADVLAPLDELQAAAMQLANEIAANAPLAVQSTRATFRQGVAEAVKAQTDHELIEQSWLRKTKDFAEGVRAVNERRAGNFVGA